MFVNLKDFVKYILKLKLNYRYREKKTDYFLTSRKIYTENKKKITRSPDINILESTCECKIA